MSPKNILDNNNTTKKNTSFVMATFLILLYSAIQIVLLLHHEPWEDEAQAWLIARDLDIVSIFRQMSYEGSPALWHMLLLPFAKTGLPYISEFILHLIIAVAAVTVFVLYAPFSNLTKVLFIFSYYMAYEYSIIARTYSLSILLVFLIAALYNKRFEYPLWHAFLIFLLFNTNVHSFFISFSLTILFAWEIYRNSVQGGKPKIAVLVMCLGGLLSFFQLLPQPDTVDYRTFIACPLPAPFIATANAFFPWEALFCPLITQVEQRLILITIAVLIFFIVISSLSKKPVVLFMLLLSFSGLFYIFAFQYHGARRHHGLILILLLFALWISRYYRDSQNKLSNKMKHIKLARLSIGLINVCLALSLLYASGIQYLEYKYPFSGAKEMADFIMKNHLDQYTIIATRSQAAALLPYFTEKKFWYAGIGAYGTFVTYNKKYLAGKEISNEQVFSKIEKAFPDKSHLLLLLTKPLDFSESHGFKLLYKVDKDIFGYGPEKFYLYEAIS